MKKIFTILSALFAPMAIAEALGKILDTLPDIAVLMIFWAFMVVLLSFIIIKTEEVKNEIFKSNHNRQ